MHMFERKNKEPIFVVLSKKIATTLEEDEMNETLDKLFTKIDGKEPDDIETWTVSVKNYEIVGIFNRNDIALGADSVTIIFHSEY